MSHTKEDNVIANDIYMNCLDDNVNATLHNLICDIINKITSLIILQLLSHQPICPKS